MKAWVLHDIGDLRLETVDEPELQEKEVLVKVKAAGICGSDIPRIYQNGAYSHPLIPGHEFSGSENRRLCRCFLAGAARWCISVDSV